MTQINADQWVTLSEASTLTGRSMDYLRTQIRRHKLTQVKKIRGKRGDEWVINREAVNDLGQADQARQINADHADQQTGQMITLPMVFYAEQLKERDQALQGLMMYRYKFEEIERQVRLLPAPVEIIPSKFSELEAKTSELEEKTAALSVAENIIQQAQETQKQYEEAMEQLKLKLQEEEHAKEAFRIQWELSQADLKRPWWQRLWKRYRALFLGRRITA